MEAATPTPRKMYMTKRRGSFRFVTLDLSPAGQADLGVGHHGDDRGYHVGAGCGEAEVEGAERRFVEVVEAGERRVVRAAARQDVRLGEELERAYRREDGAEEDDGPQQRHGDPEKAGEAPRAVHARGIVQLVRDVLQAGEI